METKVVKQIVKQLHKKKKLEEQNHQELATNYGVPGATRTRDPLLRRSKVEKAGTARLLSV